MTTGCIIFDRSFDRSFLLLNLPSSLAIQKLHSVSTAVAILFVLHQCGVALLCPASAVCRSPASALHVSTSDILRLRLIRLEILLQLVL